MVNWWFGARWFGILEVPRSEPSLSEGRSQISKPPGPQTSNLQVQVDFFIG